METTFVLKPYRCAELADRYKVSVRTFKKWLKPFEKKIGKMVGHFYLTYQVVMIVEILGNP